MNKGIDPKAFGGSRRWRAPLALLALASGGLAGCGDNQETQLDEILRDGDLTLLSRHGLTIAAGPVAAATGGIGAGGGVGGAAGGTVSTGGRTGSGTGGTSAGGAAFDGGVSTGGSGAGGFATGTGGSKPPSDGGGSAGFDGGMGGEGGGGGQFPEEAKGRWRFDDCFPERTELGDSGFFGHTAFRSVSVACATGFQNQGIAIDGSDDYVYLPDQPDFTFERGVTAAAFVKPSKLGDIRTIFRKRDGGSSTFVLLTNGKDYQFVVRLSNGRAVEVSARGIANVWTHVAGTYDGKELRLYLNGALAARTRAVGRLAEGAGPLLMGNDANGRRIDGLLDDVFFDNVAITPAQVGLLNCISRPPTIVGVPAVGPTVPAGTPVSYDVTVTNNDSRFCAPAPFSVEAFVQDPGIFVEQGFSFLELAPGASEHATVTVNSTPEVEPDTFSVQLQTFRQADPFDAAFGTVSYSVQGTPCSVRSRKELMIRDVSVVDDPVRAGPGGAWSFGRLMENMAPSAAAAPAMVEAMLSTWLSDQTVNGQVIPARPTMQDLVLSPFPRTANGQLDLTRAPMRLLAIVNRIDLRDVAQGHAGEGRFVYGVLDQFGNQTQFTMILEYKIPATTAQDVLDSANRWHGLSELPFPSAQYNAALQVVTDRFTKRNAAPGNVNGSALSQLRTNEIVLSFEWQFREFHLAAANGQLTPAAIALTPGRQFNRTQTLTDYINANQAAIINQTHTVPLTFAGLPFLSGSVTNDLNGWDATGVNGEARQKFSINTCNGCHSLRETRTFFLQVNPREIGQESFLSAFLLGAQVFDGPAGVIRTFNDLGRRNRDLHLLLCPNDMVPPLPPDMPIPGAPDGGTGGRSGRGGAIGSSGGSSGAGGEFGAGGMTGAAGKPGTSGGASGTSSGGASASGGSASGGSASGGSASGGRTGGGSGGVTGGASARAAASSAPAGTPVVDESTVDSTRSDFVTKGINRTH